jgi:hypothetical protein
MLLANSESNTALVMMVSLFLFVGPWWRLMVVEVISSGQQLWLAVMG